jgi:hypothetical protein
VCWTIIFLLLTGRITHESRYSAEHPGPEAAAAAYGQQVVVFHSGRLLRPPQDGLTHCPLLRQRRLCRSQDLPTDVGAVVWMSLEKLRMRHLDKKKSTR